ncbi:MAG: hypothetical protein IJ563_09315 [Selenomonadaceae bacterium]|nr:hypothetical protein [Selenomonadaceae bacterium]MBR1858563.1 hypothetical protein [Selenomonadaceae bacterium]
MQNIANETAKRKAEHNAPFNAKDHSLYNQVVNRTVKDAVGYADVYLKAFFDEEDGIINQQLIDFFNHGNGKYVQLEEAYKDYKRCQECVGKCIDHQPCVPVGIKVIYLDENGKKFHEVTDIEFEYLQHCRAWEFNKNKTNNENSKAK